MSNEVVTTDCTSLTTTANSDLMSIVNSSSEYLPRVQLQIGNSTACQDGKIDVNHFALINEQQYHDLGKTVDIMVIAQRPKAMLIQDKQVVTITYDPKIVDGKTTGAFADIQAMDANGVKGAMFGIEYLIYVPSAKKFATLYMGNKSTRRVSKAIMERMGRAATLVTKKITTRKGDTYFSTDSIDCSTPFEQPTQEEIAKYVTLFANVPEYVEPEVASKPEERG